MQSISFPLLVQVGIRLQRRLDLDLSCQSSFPENPDVGARSSGFKESVFDAMSQGASLREAEFDNGQLALITVHCFQHKLGWKVVFLPGCSITNHSDTPLTVSTVTPRPREASGDLASPRLTSSPRTASENAWDLHTKEQQVMQISPDDGHSRQYLPVLKLNRAARTPLSVSTLRVWLGRGNGWSIPFILYSTQTQVAFCPSPSILQSV